MGRSTGPVCCSFSSHPKAYAGISAGSRQGKGQCSVGRTCMSSKSRPCIGVPAGGALQGLLKHQCYVLPYPLYPETGAGRSASTLQVQSTPDSIEVDCRSSQNPAVKAASPVMHCASLPQRGFESSWMGALQVPHMQRYHVTNTDQMPGQLCCGGTNCEGGSAEPVCPDEQHQLRCARHLCCSKRSTDVPQAALMLITLLSQASEPQSSCPPLASCQPVPQPSPASPSH